MVSAAVMSRGCCCTAQLLLSLIAAALFTSCGAAEGTQVPGGLDGGPLGDAMRRGLQQQGKLPNFVIILTGMGRKGGWAH